MFLDFPKSEEELRFEAKIAEMDRTILWDYIAANKETMTCTELIIAFGYRSLLLTPEEKAAEDAETMRALTRCAAPPDADERELKIVGEGLGMVMDDMMNKPKGTKH